MIRDNLKKFKVEKGKNLRVTSRAGLGVIGSFAGQIGLFKRLEGLERLNVHSSARPEKGGKSLPPFVLALKFTPDLLNFSLIENLG